MGPRVGSIVIAGMFIIAACAPTGSDLTTSTHPVNTSTTTTTGPMPSEACSGEPHTPTDPEALAVQSLSADIDGDSFEDTVTGYLLGASNPTEATAAVIHLELASGWGTALRIDELELADGPAMAEPGAVVTMSGDQLLVARVADISAGQLFAFFVFEDCSLRVVTTEDGVLPEFWVGGGRTHDDWFVCESDRVSMVQFGTSNPDADPKIYGAGATQSYEYMDGVFGLIRSADVDVALPATRAGVASVYPPCVG